MKVMLFAVAMAVTTATFASITYTPSKQEAVRAPEAVTIRVSDGKLHLYRVIDDNGKVVGT